jgi:hypothetical protein
VSTQLILLLQLCDLEAGELAASFSSKADKGATAALERGECATAGPREASAAFQPSPFGHDRLPDGVCLNTKVHETSGWIPVKQWQRCVSRINERVCSLISGAGGIGSGALKTVFLEYRA